MALPNYVKFQRGTLVAYNRLATKDENTLYFIYDANDSTKGTLYLGTRLIGNVGGSGGASTLAELSDVLVSNANTGDFLVLNSQGKWAAVSASDVAQTILSAGGNFVDIDQTQFNFNSVSGKLELKGYETASTGMIPVKSASGLIWQAAPADLSGRVGNLESGLSQAQTDISSMQTELSSVDSRIATAIAGVNHLRYEIITDLQNATATNVIYLYSNGSSDFENRYNEYMLIDGILELIGAVDVDLSNYMTAQEVQTALNQKASASDLSSLQTRVGTLETNLSDLPTTVSNLSSTVGGLETSVTNLTTRISTLENANYVLTSTFNAVVGNMALVNGVKNDLNVDASISDNLIDIYDRLTWQEISE